MNEQIEIQVFGAFRKYVPSGKLRLPVQGPCSVDGIKELIRQALCGLHPRFAEFHLIADSVLATESEVLSEDAVVDLKTASLALLPPVCGG